MDYSPHGWVILKMQTPEGDLYKVFGGWYGGFAGSDSWKLNSGITKVNNIGEGCYELEGYSGSVYTVHISAENHLGFYHESILQNLIDKSKKVLGEDKVSLISFRNFLVEFNPVV